MDQYGTPDNNPMMNGDSGSSKVAKAWLIILFLAVVITVLAVQQILSFSDY